MCKQQYQTVNRQKSSSIAKHFEFREGTKYLISSKDKYSYPLEERFNSFHLNVPHTPTLLENAVYNEWQFQAFSDGQWHNVLHYYKVSGNSVERFQRSYADKLFQ